MVSLLIACCHFSRGQDECYTNHRCDQVTPLGEQSPRVDSSASPWKYQKRGRGYEDKLSHELLLSTYPERLTHHELAGAFAGQFLEKRNRPETKLLKCSLNQQIRAIYLS
jgi:hypothetical protein